MTRVMITGAGGFVGSHVVRTILEETDWHVVCVDSFRHNGLTDRLALAARGYHERIDVITHDLAAPFSSRQQGRIGRLHYIVNTASLCQVDQSIAEPESFVRNNVDVTLNVLQLAQSCASLEHMIHLSTDEVYGPHNPRTFTDHRPSSPYAASKAMQEDLCHAYAHTYGTPITIVNSANMFGERQSKLAFIPRILFALATDSTLTIHAHDGGFTRRNYTYVQNVAHRIVMLLGDTTNASDRVWLAGQGDMNNFELASKIAHLYGTELRYVIQEVTEVRPGHDDYYPKLGDPWDVRWSFEEGLKRTVDWAKTNQDWLLD